MISLNPNNVTSFPGARVQFSASRDGSPLALSTLVNARVEIYFPGEGQQLATIHESDNTFSWIVPMQEGSHEVRVIISWQDETDEGGFIVNINPVLAARFTYQTMPSVGVVIKYWGSTETFDYLSNYRFINVLHADIYNPMGQLVFSSPMTFNGMNYEITHHPGADWFEGEYKIAVRDDSGVQDVGSVWIERPALASMKAFFELPVWQRQIIEYLKYEMMNDTDPLHPGAMFTLEEYAKHWSMVVREINDIPPYTMYHPQAIPMFWANTVLKGTTLRVFHSLANRAVTIPRWQNMNVPIQDESHYQQAWESRYQALRPEYEEERAYMKAAHLPNAAITVDPFLGFVGGNLAGTTGLAMIGRPSWFAGLWGGGSR